jgi:hypothetical protein
MGMLDQAAFVGNAIRQRDQHDQAHHASYESTNAAIQLGTSSRATDHTVWHRVVVEDPR